MPRIYPVSPMTPDMTAVQRSDATDRLEALFLEQMLDGIGVQAREGSFSGGAGEQQFQSFLNQQYADILSQSIDLKLGVDTR